MERNVLVAFGLLVLTVSATGKVAQVDHFYYPIEVNRELIECKMCPPGTFWIKHCSQDGGNSQCQDCQDGHFKKLSNRAIYCKRCTECTGYDLPSGEVVVQACTRFHDTICGCKPGYWREEGKVGDCQNVSPCGPGNGVKKMANSHNDTACEICVNGKTFSNMSSEVTPCQNCSVCPEGWVQKHPCNETEDTVCVPKDEVEDGSVGGIVGAICGAILAVAILFAIIIACFCPENTKAFLQMLCCSLNNRWHKGKLDEEEQANQQQPFMVSETPQEKSYPDRS